WRHDNEPHERRWWPWFDPSHGCAEVTAMADSQHVLKSTMRVRPAARASSQSGRGSGRFRDWRLRLVFHHVPLAMAGAFVVLLFTGLSPFSSGRLSMSRFVAASGYVAFAIVGLTLLMGPVNFLLRRRHPGSSHQPPQGAVHKPPIHQLL